MKDRRKRGPLLPWIIVFRCTITLLVIFGFTFSTFRLFFTGVYHPELVSSWRTLAMEAISGDSSPAQVISVGETVMFPDQVLVLLKYPPSTPLLTKDEMDCAYYSPNSSRPQLKTSPLSIGGEYLDHQIVRCEVPPRGTTTSVSLKSHGNFPSGATHDWKRLAYEALIDRDNTTVVFVKGLNLRPGRAANASRFQCVYGWDFTKGKFLLKSEVVSIAQEIVRCKTPLSVLTGQQKVNGNSIKVSVKVIGRAILPSVARPEPRTAPDPPIVKHQMCICTMVRNQARFLREWVMYHSRIGVERWFIYDNNSNDDIENITESLSDQDIQITRHLWPWIKTQEAGFAHCALRARDSCKWVGFIDVDEFLHFPSGFSLGNILSNQSIISHEVAEIRTNCHNFGPSGLTRVPRKGVTVGYTCRLSLAERHKSIVRPEGLDPTLINMVHHFHLKEGFKYVNMDRNMMVINHYKYQVWEVFKEKFYRRVATYVSDWQQEENVGSRDRAPGLGTRAVEPDDWSTRFCEVADTGLRDWVLETFNDPSTGMLPWQYKEEDRFL